MDLLLKFKDFSININKLTLKLQLAKRVLTPESNIVRVLNNCRQSQRSSLAPVSLRCLNAIICQNQSAYNNSEQCRRIRDRCAFYQSLIHIITITLLLSTRIFAEQ